MRSLVQILFCAAVSLSLLFSVGCDSKSYRLQEGEQLIAADAQRNSSSPAGNLITTALKEVHQLDVVLYPSPLLNTSESVTAHSHMDDYSLQRLTQYYPSDSKDHFILGTMSGKNIKKLILERTSERYALDLEVAGIKYWIQYTGGYPQASFVRDHGVELKDDQNYRVAINEFYYFSGATFPGYKYRNGMNFNFTEAKRGISARAALQTYLKAHRGLPFLKERRAVVDIYKRGNVGFKAIHEIQGPGHRSPYYAHTVITEGIVTAVGNVQWYPGGVDLYIQSVQNDNDERTSEGLHVFWSDESQNLRISDKQLRKWALNNKPVRTSGLKLGDVIRVTGTVYEQLTNSGLGRTSLRDVEFVELIDEGDDDLPQPVILSESGRNPPRDFISTYKGNLNLKPHLVLTDGIDFWESLEGMRVQVNNPQVVGFRGGKEEMHERGAKGYLNIYAVPDGNQGPAFNKTPKGGVIIDELNLLFNPQIFQIVSNHLTKKMDPNTVFNVGDIITGKLTGVLGYEKNIFGEGEYAMVLPEPQTALDDFSKRKGENTVISLADRPHTQLTAGLQQLLVATFNVENLSGNSQHRLQVLAEVVQNNLNCPDILNLVEIQDANGVDQTGRPDATATLTRLIKLIRCPDVNYHYVNVDPILNDEGGQPGGNIRVAMLYNQNKLSFDFRPVPNALSETLVRRDGSINYNPGRIYPNNKAFAHTRKSLIAEFMFMGQRLFVIGNHFNSKLGDSNLWGANQPVVFNSEIKRSLLADKINDFVELLAIRSPQSHVIVLGDFNAYIGENAMKVLEGTHLRNLLSFGNLVPKNDRYTTNFNGNSQSLDYIFASHSLLERNPQVQILHINSDYMGRISDHDPVVALFQF